MYSNKSISTALLSSVFALAALGGLVALGACGSEDGGDPLEKREQTDQREQPLTGLNSERNPIGYHTTGMRERIEDLRQCEGGSAMLDANGLMCSGHHNDDRGGR